MNLKTTVTRAILQKETNELLSNPIFTFIVGHKGDRKFGVEKKSGGHFVAHTPVDDLLTHLTGTKQQEAGNFSTFP